MNSQDLTGLEVNGEIITPDEHAKRQRDSVQGLYSTFAAMRDEWVLFRANSPVEKRWRKATELYFGDSDEQTSGELASLLKTGPSPRKGQAENRSKVVVNIVRPKVDQAIARMCEILLPVDDRNWAIRPSPVPETDQMLGNHAPTIDPATGQPTGLTADAEANGLIKATKEAADAMQESIDDELTECKYNGESRSLIEDGVRLGTGIMKGPFPTRHCDKVWRAGQGGQQAMEIKHTTRPASKHLDPWNVYFDPSCGNDHQRGRGVWERRSVTRREIRALVDIDGYDTDALREVLNEPPKRVTVAEGRVIRDASVDKSYELWEYHGEVEAEDLTSLSAKAGDPITDVDFAVIVMINDKIVGALPSWVGDKTLPYDVWNWRRADDSPCGYGLPDELEHQQSVVNAAWRQVMDNAKWSTGGQIVVKKGRILPANGQWEMSPNKLWYAKEDEVDVKDAFTTFEFASHSQELLGVAQAAMNFADLESGMPQIMGGEQGSAPETVGGMVMLYNNANAVLRQRVKLYDDGVTRPHITRYYDFKMANDPDDKIKGDFDVDARGSSSLVERDIQNQAMVNLANITSNPRYSPHMQARAEIKAILKSFKLNPDDMMKTEDEVAKDAANSQPVQDPRVQAAQIIVADNQQKRAFDLQENEKDRGIKKEELAYNQEREQGRFTVEQTKSEVARDTALLRDRSATQIAGATIASRERLGAMNIESKHQLFNAEATLRTRTGEGI